MNNKTVTLLIALAAVPIMAQEPPPPPGLPDIPSAPGGFNPTNPFSTPQPLEPIQPVDPLQATDVPDLPRLETEEEFDFFQPGAQLGDLNLEDETDQQEEVVEEAPAPAPVKHQVRPKFSKRFNYKNQILPPPIYKKHYDRQNRHLPKAQYQHDYDAAAFVAAAKNDLNGLRAMIDYGGRNIAMRDTRGMTLADMAMAHNAHNTLRYLLAKGAPVSNQMRGDRLSQYALRAGR